MWGSPDKETGSVLESFDRFTISGGFGSRVRVPSGRPVLDGNEDPGDSMESEAGATTIALLTACSDPGLGIRSSIVQELLDEATADPRLARQVITTMLTASVLSLKAYAEATEREPAEVLQALGLSWSARSLEV
jgi:hypothetical protein